MQVVRVCGTTMAVLAVTAGCGLQDQDNLLYSNNGDGSFTQITDGPVVSDGGHSYSAAWVDVVVRWPSGKESRMTNIVANQRVVVTEGS